MSRLALPAVGFGCSPPRSGRAADLPGAMEAALELGYRLFDTAEAYGSEPSLGALLAGDRRRVAIVSKVWQTNHARVHVRAACEGSLRRLRRDALDLYLVHAPVAWAYRCSLEVGVGTREELDRLLVPRRADGTVELAAVTLEETWGAMGDLRRDGLVRSIGLANVGVAELERLRLAGAEPPAAVQVELHPLRRCSGLVDYCRERSIVVMAHSPLGGGQLLARPQLRRLARRSGRSVAELVLGWHRARGVVPVVGSCDPEHLRANLHGVDAVPGAEVLAELDGLEGAAGGEDGHRAAPAAPARASRD